MGNTNVKPLVWDRKTESWISSSEVDARNALLKSKHLLNNPDSPTSNDEEDNGGEIEDPYDTDGAPGKRRKTNSGLQERIFETKKWVQVPAAIAEKLAEPKYLADRRPGMESLYGGAYKATNGFGSLGINPGAGSGAAGFDLGDGSGLGNAGVVLGAGAAVPEPAPVRKNMPPKRKKKKLGGPGRKKANPVPTGIDTPTTQPSDVVMTDTPIETPSQQAAPEVKLSDTQNEEGEASGSDSEGEGSEEGEIEEDGNPQSQPRTELAPDSQPEGAPEVPQSTDEAPVETMESTAGTGITSEPKVVEAPVSGVIPELIPDLGTGVSLSQDTEMQDVIATDAIPDQLGIPQPTIPSLPPGTAAAVNPPDLDPLPTSTTISADIQMSEQPSNSQAAASIEEIGAETDVRPVLEQITPEPILPAAEVEAVVAPTTPPLDPTIEAPEAQAQSQSQFPQIVSEPSNGPAEENTPAAPPPDPALDKNLPLNLAEPPLIGNDSATQSSALPSDPEPIALPTEPTIPASIESTTLGDKGTTFTSAQAETTGSGTDNALDLLGGLEAAVDKEATANTSVDATNSNVEVE